LYEDLNQVSTQEASTVEAKSSRHTSAEELDNKKTNRRRVAVNWR
jgi:hypothetical protein